MNVSEVVDIEGSFQNSVAIKAGDKFTVQGFSVRHVESLGSDIVEIKTTEGLRHSFGKTVIGQSKSEYWNDVVEKCVSKDASDGLDVWVLEKEATGSNRKMLTHSMFPPNE